MYESGISHSPLPTPYSLLSSQRAEGKKVCTVYLGSITKHSRCRELTGGKKEDKNGNFEFERA
jgi:hypothetical protein